MPIDSMVVAAGWGGIALALLLVVWARRLRARRRGAARGLVMLALPVAALAIVALWYRHRPWPSELELELADGIEVHRVTTSTPRPLLLSVAQIDLRTPGLEIVTTEVAPDGTVAARTTSEFAQTHRAVLAVNTHFFTPFWSKSPWDYYPQAGDPVSPLGLSAADGRVVDRGGWSGATVWVSAQGSASMSRPPAEPWDAITGRYRLVQDGRVVAPVRDELAPRVALGIGEGGHRLVVVVIDGRQPGYAEGVTLRELAEIVLDWGAVDAVELDGGGSAAMVIASPGGADPRLVNTPIHTRWPGRERPVAAHLGVRLSTTWSRERS